MKQAEEVEIQFKQPQQYNSQEVWVWKAFQVDSKAQYLADLHSTEVRERVGRPLGAWGRGDWKKSLFLNLIPIYNGH